MVGTNVSCSAYRYIIGGKQQKFYLHTYGSTVQLLLQELVGNFALSVKYWAAGKRVSSGFSSATLVVMVSSLGDIYLGKG